MTALEYGALLKPDAEKTERKLSARTAIGAVGLMAGLAMVVVGAQFNAAAQPAGGSELNNLMLTSTKTASCPHMNGWIAFKAVTAKNGASCCETNKGGSDIWVSSGHRVQDGTVSGFCSRHSLGYTTFSRGTMHKFRGQDDASYRCCGAAPPPPPPTPIKPKVTKEETLLLKKGVCNGKAWTKKFNGGCANYAGPNGKWEAGQGDDLYHSLANRPWAGDKQMTVLECQARCAATDGCTSIAYGNPGKGPKGKPYMMFQGCCQLYRRGCRKQPTAVPKFCKPYPAYCDPRVNEFTWEQYDC